VPTQIAELPDNVIEHEGMLWRPKQGASSSPQEFLAARALFIELHQDSGWNPWVLEDRTDDLERAQTVMTEWTRAEPGHRTMTKKQLDEKMARWDRDFKLRQAAIDERREKDKGRFDAETAHARLSLIERQSRLDYEEEELARFLDGTRFPAMPADRRRDEIAKLGSSIASLRESVEGLAATVGDLEVVVDEHGWLPSDRRERMLVFFRLDRERDVRELRIKLTELRAQLDSTTDRYVRAKLRAEVDRASRKLQDLLDITELTVDDMCSECPTPMSKHGWVTPPFTGPCPAWPRWAARLREARGIFERVIARTDPPPPPKPEPLAVVPSGLPISEVMARLAEIQETYPDAEVRRGRANRWEVWPSDKEPSAEPIQASVTLD
jgi:hypothetical protein